MKLNNKQVYSQALVHKPVKNTIFHLRHVVVLHSLQVFCAYQYEKDPGGFYEVWRAKNQQAYTKCDISYIAQITRPFEYDDETIAFFDAPTGKLFRLHYNEQGFLTQFQLQLPSKTFREIMSLEIDDTVLEKYLSTSYTYIYERKILIVGENLSAFESPTGDVCEDYIISSWTANAGWVGEALLKKTN
jgi:hypothetical protein